MARWWDFHTYTDTEALVAHAQVIGWILDVMDDVDKFPNFYDPDLAQITMDIKVSLIIWPLLLPLSHDFFHVGSINNYHFSHHKT